MRKQETLLFFQEFTLSSEITAMMLLGIHVLCFLLKLVITF